MLSLGDSDMYTALNVFVFKVISSHAIACSEMMIGKFLAPMRLLFFGAADCFSYSVVESESGHE